MLDEGSCSEAEPFALQVHGDSMEPEFKHGCVIVIDPAGEPFDPEFHEAISVQPSENVEPGSVLTVVQKGYSLNGRLLRPALVIVAEK